MHAAATAALGTRVFTRLRDRRTLAPRDPRR
jgi:hypothetical protein